MKGVGTPMEKLKLGINGELLGNIGQVQSLVTKLIYLIVIEI